MPRAGIREHFRHRDVEPATVLRLVLGVVNPHVAGGVDDGPCIGLPNQPLDRVAVRDVERVPRQRAIRELAETFDVNPVVARIRLEEVFPNVDGAQLKF